MTQSEKVEVDWSLEWKRNKTLYDALCINTTKYYALVWDGLRKVRQCKWTRTFLRTVSKVDYSFKTWSPCFNIPTGCCARRLAGVAGYNILYHTVSVYHSIHVNCSHQTRSWHNMRQIATDKRIPKNTNVACNPTDLWTKNKRRAERITALDV